MNFLSWIIFGFIAGAIAKAIHSGPNPKGCIPTIIIGVLGSLLGGWLGSMLFSTGIAVTGFNFHSFLVAISGSVILLFLYRMINR